MLYVFKIIISHYINILTGKQLTNKNRKVL